MSKPRTAFIVALGIAAALLASSAISTPAAAANTAITLFGSRAGGWGLTNTSLSTPGPPSNPLLPGGQNTVLIVAGVLIIVAVIAFAAFFWRRMGKRETPPPPPPQ